VVALLYIDEISTSWWSHAKVIMWLLRTRASIAIARISYGNSVCLSQPSVDWSPGEIEFWFSLHDSLESLVFWDKI